MACSSSLALLASFDRWQGRSTAGLLGDNQALVDSTAMTLGVANCDWRWPDTPAEVADGPAGAAPKRLVNRIQTGAVT